MKILHRSEEILDNLESAPTNYRGHEEPPCARDHLASPGHGFSELRKQLLLTGESFVADEIGGNGKNV